MQDKIYGNTEVNSGYVHLGDVIHNTYFSLPQDPRERDHFLNSIYYTSRQRKESIYVANDATCQWIWSSVFGRWLRTGRPKLFWIKGKPGSGKSTLMKYVSNNITKIDKTWSVVSFFFDFRQGKEVRNSFTGLLKDMIWQLKRCVPGWRELSAGNEIFETEAPVSVLQDRVHSILELCENDVRLFFLIDGLDECSLNNREGLDKMLSMLKYLKSFRRYQNIKMCLASRPENAIADTYGDLPSLDMALENASAINAFVEEAAANFRPYLDKLLLPDVQALILDQAQGVFIWVHLAIKAVMNDCINRATATEIKHSLTALPTELEEMYARIIDRMAENRRAEAAIIYILIADSTIGIHFSLETLYSTICFLAQSCQIGSVPADIPDVEHFKQRLHATMGGLIDTGRFLKVNDLEWMGDRNHVQLAHATVRSFSQKSQWYQRLIPADFTTRFPDTVWSRIIAKSLVVADDYTVEISRVLYLEGRNNDDLLGRLCQALASSSSTLPVTKWVPLIITAIYLVADLTECALATGTPGLFPQLQQALKSHIASIHFALPMKQRTMHMWLKPVDRMLMLDLVDLTLAAAHQSFGYLMCRLTYIKTLSDDCRDELIFIISHYSKEICDICLSVPQKVRDPQVTIFSLIDNILTINDKIEVFHLNVFLWVGYNYIPGFLSRQSANSFRQNFPTLTKTNTTSLGRPFKTCHPLFRWLQTLLLHNLDIDYIDPRTGYNVIHYLISTHIIHHTHLDAQNDWHCYPDSDMYNSVLKLYLLERAGADFTYQFRYRTPLQVLRLGIDRIVATPVQDRNFDEYYQPDRLYHMAWMLEHKEQTGHLPQPYQGGELRPQPTVKLDRLCDICPHSNDHHRLTAEGDSKRHMDAFIPSRPAPRPPIPLDHNVSQIMNKIEPLVSLSTPGNTSQNYDSILPAHSLLSTVATTPSSATPRIPNIVVETVENLATSSNSITEASRPTSPPSTHYGSRSTPRSLRHLPKTDHSPSYLRPTASSQQRSKSPIGRCKSKP